MQVVSIWRANLTEELLRFGETGARYGDSIETNRRNPEEETHLIQIV